MYDLQRRLHRGFFDLLEVHHSNIALKDPNFLEGLGTDKNDTCLGTHSGRRGAAGTFPMSNVDTASEEKTAVQRYPIIPPQ